MRKTVPKKRKPIRTIEEKRKPRVIGIVGSRRRDSKLNYDLVKLQFKLLYREGDIICSGLCPRGADWFAVLFSLGKKYITNEVRRKEIMDAVIAGNIKYKIPVKWFPAKWDRYGKTAGFIRNTLIAEESDILIACVASDRKGGTEDTVQKFVNYGKGKLYLV